MSKQVTNRDGDTVRVNADGHADYPHHPGQLPGCPACDEMEED